MIPKFSINIHYTIMLSGFNEHSRNLYGSWSHISSHYLLTNVKFSRNRLLIMCCFLSGLLFCNLLVHTWHQQAQTCLYTSPKIVYEVLHCLGICVGPIVHIDTYRPCLVAFIRQLAVIHKAWIWPIVKVFSWACRLHW